MHPQISGVNTYFRETCKGNWRVGEGEGCNIASQNCAALTSVGLATGIIIRSAEVPGQGETEGAQYAF